MFFFSFFQDKMVKNRKYFLRILSTRLLYDSLHQNNEASLYPNQLRTLIHSLVEGNPRIGKSYLFSPLPSSHQSQKKLLVNCSHCFIILQHFSRQTLHSQFNVYEITCAISKPHPLQFLIFSFFRRGFECVGFRG